MQSKAERIINALVYALVAGGGYLQGAGWPGRDPMKWIALLVCVIPAGWGKYSTSTRFLLPDREQWPDQVRKIEAGAKG